MKTKAFISTCIVALAICSVAKAQKLKNAIVPASVTAALKDKYPKAGKVTWEKEKGNYEANWGGKSGEDMSVLFTPSGSFVEQVEAIKPEALPAPAMSYLKDHYKGTKVKEAGKVTDAAGKITYEAEVKKLEVVFDEQGKFVKAREEND
ncbi:MAG TPA: PepSY-like domain-containing protein [Mucilaginibacter sp.]